MFKFLSSLLLFLIPFISRGQEPFFKYKQVADKLIKQQFDTSLLKLIKCEEFFVETSDSTSTSYPSYEKFKFKKDNVVTITFTFSFFSASINNTFDFEVSLNSKMQIINAISISDSIPMCIKKNLNCDFIPRISAIQIAIADSIEYKNNLKVTFDRAPNQADFYWVIEGHSPQINKSHIRHTASKRSPASTKYINAKTGKIVTRAYFFKKV